MLLSKLIGDDLRVQFRCVAELSYTVAESGFPWGSPEFGVSGIWACPEHSRCPQGPRVTL